MAFRIINKVVLIFLLIIGLNRLKAQSVLALWDFDALTISGTGTAPTISGGTGTTANAGILTTGSTISAFHASASTAWTSPVGNGNAKSISSNNWGVNDYYQFKFSTTGYDSIKISFSQTGSNTGPRDFEIQYSTNGSSFTTLTGSSYTLTNGSWSSTSFNSSNKYTFNISSKTNALNNIANAYIRLVCTSTNAISGTFGSAGTGRVDSFRVTGLSCNSLSLAASTKSALPRRCIAGSSIYYGDGTGVYFAIDTTSISSGSMIGASVDITVGSSPTISQSSNGAHQEHRMFLMGRYWNVNSAPSFSGWVKIKFPYNPADTSALLTARDAAYSSLLSTNPNTLAVKNSQLEWFKTQGVPYNATLISSIVGNKFPASGVIKYSPVYSSASGVSCVELSPITSFSGGTAGYSYGPRNGFNLNALAVTWAGFDVKSTEMGNKLIWKTASEKNTDYFEVEYSYDGVNFNKSMIQIPAAGNSSSVLTYSYLHKDFSSFIYYRIRQVDQDAKYDYSVIKMIKRTSDNTFNVSFYPLPVSDNNEVNLTITAIDKSEVKLRIMNMTGQEVFSKSIFPTSDYVSEKINLSNLMSGVYQLEVMNYQAKKMIKFSK